MYICIYIYIFFFMCMFTSFTTCVEFHKGMHIIIHLLDIIFDVFKWKEDLFIVVSKYYMFLESKYQIE